MKPSLCCIVLFTSLTFGLAAEGSGSTAFGLAIAAQDASGLSFRTFNGPWGWEAEALPIVGPSGYYLSLGASVLYTVHEAPSTRLFAYAGPQFTGANASGNLSVAAGVGLELVLFDHLVFGLRQGLSAGLAQSGLSVSGGLWYRL